MKIFPVVEDVVSVYSILYVSEHFTGKGICRNKLQIHYMIKTPLLKTEGLSPLLNEKPSMPFSLLVLFSSSRLKSEAPRFRLSASLSTGHFRCFSQITERMQTFHVSGATSPVPLFISRIQGRTMGRPSRAAARGPNYKRRKDKEI